MLTRLHPLWLLVAGYWLWMIWACAGEWTNSEDYNYGWFVPPLALYFLWKRLEGAPRADTAPPGSGRALAWAVIALSLLVTLPLEIVRQTPIHWRPNLWAVAFLAVANTLAVAWLTGGRARFKIFLIPTLFMLVGVPWPTFVESAVAYPLMPVVTRWAVGILHFLGYPATAARIIWVAAIGKMILNLILMPLWGALGAAIGTAIMLAFWNLWLWLEVRKKLQLEPTILAIFKK